MKMRFSDSVVVFLSFASLAGAFPKGGPEPRAKEAELDIDTRIVGGAEITAHSWRFLVHIGKDGNNDYQGVHCGGTIIDANTVVSAAHCFHNQGVSIDAYRVTAGEHSLETDEGVEQRSKVVKIMLHPDYDSQIYRNDVAVIKLETAIDLSKNQVAALTLNSNTSCPATGDNCKVAGWGDLQYKGSPPDKAHEVTVPVISNADCESADQFYNQKVFDTNICTAYPGGGKDSCQGDSGGPFICECDGNDVLAGIISWGYQCAVDGMPGVYARVSSYLAWINQCTANNGNNCPGYSEGGSGGGGGGGATNNPGREF